jgi:hypothetical protein
MVHADDVNILSKNINTIKKNKALRDTCKEVGLEVTKYITMSCHQNAGQYHDSMIPNKSLKMSSIWEQ